MTNVYIKGRFLIQQSTGVQRFAREIVDALDRIMDDRKCLPGVQFVVLTPSRQFDPPLWKNIKTKRTGRFSGQLWEQVEYPIAGRDGLLLTLSGMPVLVSKNQISVLHDAAVFDASAGYSKRFAAWYRFGYRTAAARNSICTVSEFSKRRLSSVLGQPVDRFSLVYNGADHMGRISEDRSIFDRFPALGDSPYVLTVGSAAPNKNFRVVAEAARLLVNEDIRFVVVGQTYGKVFGNGGHTPKDMISLGYVSDSELKALYLNAACFVFPSLYEGFGIPALEAMWCGCCVVASNASAIPEVCGDAALYFDPKSPEELASVLKRAITSPSLRETLREAGVHRAGEFTWDRSARSLIEVIRAKLNPGPEQPDLPFSVR